MKTNSKDNNQSSRLESAGRPASNYGPRLCALCLLLCLWATFATTQAASEQADPNTAPAPKPTQITNDPNAQKPAEANADKDTPAKADDKSPGKGFLISKSPTTALGRSLWRKRFTIPKSNRDQESKDALWRIIEQVRSMEFKPQEKTPEPVDVAVVEPIPQIDPNESKIEPRPPEKTVQKPPQTEPPYEPVSDETLKILAAQLQNSQDFKSPFELGEILFHSGRLKYAAMCYEYALAGIDPNQPDSDKNTAWILFQTANCLRDENPEKSMEMYMQLIKEYADSPWAELAKALSKLTSWYQQNDPKKLIEESRPEPTDYPDAEILMLTTKEEPKTEQPKGG